MLKSILKWASIFLLIILSIAFITINVFAYKLNAPDHIIDEFMEGLAVRHKIHRLHAEDKTLRFVESGIDESWAPVVLFVHGAPGTLDAFKEYLADYDLNQKARLIAVDRPGYGGSDIGISDPDIERQAVAIQSIVDRYPSSRIIVVSHSYGSPISVVMAAKNPDAIDGLIMISPVNDPDSEPVKWYARLADFKLFRLLLPQFINVATTEKMVHREQLRKIAPYFSSVTCPVLHYHGDDDRLAPCAENIAYSKKNFNNNNLKIITEEGGGHLLIWTKGATVKSIIIDLLNQISD